MKCLRPLIVGLLSGALALTVGAASATELGRLFFSPAERALLDQARQHADVAQVVAETPEVLPVIEPVAEDRPVERQPITVNGYVRRSNGRATVWVNGVDNQRGDLGAEDIARASVSPKDGRVRLDRARGEAALTLKPGQTFDPATNEVVEIYRPSGFANPRQHGSR